MTQSNASLSSQNKTVFFSRALQLGDAYREPAAGFAAFLAPTGIAYGLGAGSFYAWPPILVFSSIFALAMAAVTSHADEHAEKVSLLDRVNRGVTVTIIAAGLGMLTGAGSEIIKDQIDSEDPSSTITNQFQNACWQSAA